MAQFYHFSHDIFTAIRLIIIVVISTWHCSIQRVGVVFEWLCLVLGLVQSMWHSAAHVRCEWGGEGVELEPSVTEPRKTVP